MGMMSHRWANRKRVWQVVGKTKINWKRCVQFWTEQESGRMRNKHNKSNSLNRLKRNQLEKLRLSRSRVWCRIPLNEISMIYICLSWVEPRRWMRSVRRSSNLISWSKVICSMRKHLVRSCRIASNLSWRNIIGWKGSGNALVMGYSILFNLSFLLLRKMLNLKK